MCTEAVDRIFSYIRGNNWSNEYSSQTICDICCDGLCEGNLKSEIEYRVSGGACQTNFVKDNIIGICKKKQHLVKLSRDDEEKNEMENSVAIHYLGQSVNVNAKFSVGLGLK